MRTASAILAFVIGLALFMGVIWVGCSSFLKNNSAYERGVETALTDPTVAKALGGSVEEGWFLNGSIEGDGMVSHGVWLVRIKGAERSGTLRIAGIKSGGEWSVVNLSLEAADVTYAYLPGQGFREVASSGVGPRDILSE